MHILLSNSQEGSGRTVKQEKEEISRNHLQAFITAAVLICYFFLLFAANLKSPYSLDITHSTVRTQCMAMALSGGWENGTA